MASVYFEELNTEVTGFSYYTPEIREPKINQASAPRDGRIHILLGHGSSLSSACTSEAVRVGLFLYRARPYPQAGDSHRQEDGLLRLPGAA